MKKLFLIHIALFLLANANSQNLVPNGDFEYYDSCPYLSFESQIHFAYPWYDPNNSTSDYFNACSPPTEMNVPCQGITCQYFQYAHSGVAYAGLYAFAIPQPNLREYIQTKLSDSLWHNKCYCVTFYINLFNFCKFGVNNVGAYLSNSAVTCPQYLPYNLTPQILQQGNAPVIDTINWIKIQNIYDANGGEQYLTIGNFAYDSTTTLQIADTSISAYNTSYYYIDDVSMYEIKSAKALFTGNDTTMCNFGNIQLGTTNYEGVTYSWSPAEGLNDSTSGTPVASPAHTTTYYLTQSTPCATTTDSVKVTVYCEPPFVALSIPTLVSGEGVFYIRGLPANSQLQLFNSLGQMVFESNNYDNLLNAVNFASGVYFYVLRTESGEEYRGKLCIIK